MNRVMNKRWCRISLLLVCIGILLSSGIITNNVYNKEFKAESISESTSGVKKMVTAADPSDHNSGGQDHVVYFLMNNGEVYVHGLGSVTSGKAGQGQNYSFNEYAVRVKNEDGSDFLKDVIDIETAGYVTVFLTSNGNLYGLGDNRKKAFGEYLSSEIHHYPKKIGNIKSLFHTNSLRQMSITSYNLFVVTETGEVYGCGNNNMGQMGTGTSDSNIYPFTEITISYEGQKESIESIASVGWGQMETVVTTETGYSYKWGYGYKPNGVVGGPDYHEPTRIKLNNGDGTFSDLRNMGKIEKSINNYFSLQDKNTKELYVIGDANYFPMSGQQYYAAEKILNQKDGDSVIAEKFSIGYFRGSYLGADGNYYFLGNLGLGGGYPQIWSESRLKKMPYPLTSEYVQDMLFNSGEKIWILYKNGEAYFIDNKFNLSEIKLGNIKVKGIKENSEVYNSKEKYNGSITFNIENSSINGEKILMKIQEDGIWSEPAEQTELTIPIDIVENERIYKTYKIYLEGKEDEGKELTVDLFHGEPTINQLEASKYVKRGNSITISAPDSFNQYQAKIIKPGGTIEETYNGEALEQVGTTTLKITDAYGNKKDYTFTVTDNSFAESVSFTPTDENGLVYGNTITKAGSVIGTLSLVYADSDTPSTIKTLTIGTEQDGAKFEKSGINQLKVKGSGLSAGTYVVPVSGTDQNDMPFSGEITIVIAKATSTMAWNSDTQSLSTDGLTLGKEVTLGVKDQPSGTTVTYGMKVSNSCITLDSTTGKVKATCVPSPASVTFTATPAGNDNYNLSALELTVPIKKQTATLNIELLDSDASYKNDVTIKIGDDLPTVRISSTDPALDVSALGTPTYTYKKGSVEVSNPNIAEGIYTVSAAFPSGSPAENYDITWNTATLRVDGITIDENNESDYFTLTSDGKPYTQGTWTNKAIIITPVHDTFNQIDINDAGNKNTSAYTYNVEGSETVKLSFYNSDGAKVSTTVTLNYDKTAPTISKFNYEEESGVRSFLRTISFDHFFGKAQQLSFTGSDETGGSGLDHYRYEIVELDKDKNELPASKKTGTLGLSEKVSLDINTSYRISAWAIDTAGNESDEKIERVFLSDEVAQLNITATSEGKNYDGTNWTKSGVSVTLSSTSGAGVEKYQYSSDGVVFHDMSGATITLPDPLNDVDNVTYTFKAIHNDRTESEKTLNLKVDTVKPELNITGTVNGSTYDGSLVDQNIEIAMNQTNTNISGTTYYYTTSPSSKDSDPTTDSNWKRYTTPMTHSANGTFTYYFKAISGAGIVSDTEEYTVKLAKKEYTNITVNVTSEGKNYSPGNWAKGDITFTLSGGIKDATQITGYEYTTTNGSIPSSSATWKPVTNKTVKLTESIKDQTYWFRVTPVDPDGKISAGTKVNLDVDEPSIPTMSVEELNNTKLAELINTLSFGSWMNKQAEVTMTSSDATSGIDHYEYIETIDGVEVQPKTSTGTIIYKDEVELTIKARACDKAGNCSAYTSAEELKIDRKAPTITGVKDQSEYKQYYTPRFVTVTDLVSGLKQATYKKDNTSAGTLTDNVETPIKGEGSYEIYAIDEAGNEITITFKILKLPNIETEIDGSDESREIIDQIIKEYEEVKDKIDQNEKDNYEEWIKDAEEKWDSLRTKVIEDNETTSKVEGQGDTTFDPKTELIVEEIPKDKVPVLPRNAIKTYDVYLKKGNTVIQPDGSVKVYLPYNEKEEPIVYEIGDDGTITELKATQEGEYVTFITNTLKKYAISNEKQKENKPDICVVGPDHKADSSDDVCGSEGSVKNDDGSVTVPEGGKVIFPDKEIEAPDGAVINPDGSVDFPDGTHFDPDGNETTKPDPKPDPNPDDKNDQVCTAGPDGKLGSDDDVCGEGNGEGVPPVKEDDGSVTVPDGGSVIFPDGSEVELPDGGIIKPDGSVVLPDGTEYNPDGSKKEPEDKEPNKKECTLIEKKELNIDTDGDGIPDINLDINGDCKPELNIDVNGDNIPDIDIDTTGNGKADINIDTNKDGKPDLNIVLNLKWKPNITYTVNGFTYNSMKNLIPDLNVDDDGNGSPDRNIDTDGDHDPDVNVDDDWYSKRGLKDPNKNTVQGSYTSNTGGASTSDHTKWSIWLITFIITIVTMLYTLKRKQKNIQ